MEMDEMGEERGGRALESEKGVERGRGEKTGGGSKKSFTASLTTRAICATALSLWVGPVATHSTSMQKCEAGGTACGLETASAASAATAESAAARPAAPAAAGAAGAGASSAVSVFVVVVIVVVVVTVVLASSPAGAGAGAAAEPSCASADATVVVKAAGG